MAVRESQQRGTVVFPLQYNLCNTANPYYDLWLHFHSEFEFIHVISGEYNIFLNEKEYKLKKDDMCLIPGSVIHGDAPEKGKSLYESIVFDIEMLRLHSFSPDLFISDILNGNIVLESILDSSRHGFKDLLSVSNNIFKSVKNREEGHDLLVCGYLLQILGLIKKNQLFTERKIMPVHKQVRTEQLEQVLNLIRRNYNQDLTLQQMSEIAGLSPKYFCRIFKEMTDRSPIEYLNWFRINRACALLRETDDKLPDIAVNCGFNDFSYFIKTFRRYKEMTPLKYRNFDPLRGNNSSKMSSTDDNGLDDIE